MEAFLAYRKNHHVFDIYTYVLTHKISAGDDSKEVQ